MARTHHEKSNKLRRQPLFYKRYIKLLAASNGHPQLTKELIKSAPIPIIKLICNAGIHASKGRVQLSDRERKLFSRKRTLFQTLVDKRIPINKKRGAILQTGGFSPIIPILLSAVISSIGPLLFEKIFPSKK